MEKNSIHACKSMKSISMIFFNAFQDDIGNDDKVCGFAAANTES